MEERIALPNTREHTRSTSLMRLLQLLEEHNEVIEIPSDMTKDLPAVAPFLYGTYLNLPIIPELPEEHDN